MDSAMVNGLRNLGYLFLGLTAVSAYQKEIILLIAVYIAAVLINYMVESPAIYKIAKRRLIPHPWLAWIPWGKSWLKGCIADQYRSTVKGKRTCRRWMVLLLLLAQLGIAAWALLECADFLMAFVVLLLLPVPMGILNYVMLYDLYASCVPGRIGAFLVLSILFGFLRPFLVLACRNKDLGMLPKSSAPIEPVRFREGES